MKHIKIRCKHTYINILYECPGLHWRWVMLHGLEEAVPFLGKPDEVLEEVPLHCHVLQEAQPALQGSEVPLQMTCPHY
jgi:hypothetical protein